MDDSRTVTPFRMRAERAQQIIREIAADTGKVIIGDHARERMGQREISDAVRGRGKASESYHYTQCGLDDVFLLYKPRQPQAA